MQYCNHCNNNPPGNFLPRPPKPRAAAALASPITFTTDLLLFIHPTTALLKIQFRYLPVPQQLCSSEDTYTTSRFWQTVLPQPDTKPPATQMTAQLPARHKRRTLDASADADPSGTQTNSSGTDKRSDTSTQEAVSKRRKAQGDEDCISTTCPLCDATFKWRKNIAVHIRVVHEKKKEFACQLCPIAFGARSNLRKHQASVHLKLRPFQCSMCTKRFVQKYTLQVHQKSCCKVRK